MTETMTVVYVLIVCLIVLAVVLMLFRDLVLSVKMVRNAGLVIAGIIKSAFPLFGTALEEIVKTFIWF